MCPLKGRGLLGFSLEPASKFPLIFSIKFGIFLLLAALFKLGVTGGIIVIFAFDEAAVDHRFAVDELHVALVVSGELRALGPAGCALNTPISTRSDGDS